MSDTARSAERAPDGLIGRPPSQRASAFVPEPRRQPGTSNQAMQRMLHGAIQAKLEVNQPDDEFEREADAAASAVMRMPDDASFDGNIPSSVAPPRVQRMSATAMDLLQREQAAPAHDDDERKRLKKEKDGADKKLSQKTVEHEQKKLGNEKKKEDDATKVQTKRAAQRVPTVMPETESTIERSRGAGTPLSRDTREHFEQRFGRDLGHVRIHSDAHAAQTAHELSAHAFTSDRDVYFAAGRYEPATTQGRMLLAHELAHTLQQAPGPSLSSNGPSAAVTSPIGEAVGARGRVSPRAAQRAAVRGAPRRTRAIMRQAAAASPPQTVEAVEKKDETTVMPLEEIPLDKGTEFIVSSTIAEWVKGKKAAPVKVRLGKLAAGTITVRERDGKYETVEASGGKYQMIALTHPALEPVQRAGLQPVLVIQIQKSQVDGYVSVLTKKGVLPKRAALTEWIEKNSAAMGWLGLDSLKMPPPPKNEIAGGVLTLEVPEFPFRLGGYFQGKGKFGLANEIVTFSATASIHVPGVTDAQLDIERDKEGKLYGHVDVPVAFQNFTGNMKGDFGNGIVSVEGLVGLRTDKLSGQITLLVTDAETARNVAKRALPPDAIKTSATEAMGKTAEGKGPKPGPRAVAGWGTVDFHLTEWMTGQAQVIVDNEGHITISGKIAPPGEIELFKQRDYIKPIFKFEVRTLYGVPLVGNLFVFANIGLEALAKLGPGKIYNIVIDGRYSTDPEIFREFSMAGTLNISAFAGLRLRGEGGAGIEILSHDIKAGVGLDALAGIKGYVEATPTIAYTEKADPKEGKKGEAHLKGHMEIAAQPFLELGGDLFVELSTPWWSPVSDHKWTWPLGELEYPLPGQFGIGADIDYLIGSGELPEVQFGQVDFSAEKFMTDLMNDHVPPKKEAAADKKGEWKEAESAPPPEAVGAGAAGAIQATAGVPEAGKPATRSEGKQEAEQIPRPENQARWLAGMKDLGDLSEASKSAPFDKRHFESALREVKAKHGFSKLNPIENGKEWHVHAEMNPSGDPPYSFQSVADEEQEGSEASGAIWQESLLNAPSYQDIVYHASETISLRAFPVRLSADSRKRATKTLHAYINRGTQWPSQKATAIADVDARLDAAQQTFDAREIYRLAREAYQIARAANPTGGLLQVHHENEVSEHPEVYVLDWLERRVSRLRKQLTSRKPRKNPEIVKNLRAIQDPIQLRNNLREWALQQLDAMTQNPSGEVLTEIELEYVDPGAHATIHRERKAEKARTLASSPGEAEE
jgi:hypothetical protein